MPPIGTILELPAQLGEIFYTIVLPILLLAGVGWVLQKTLGLEMATLKRLNFYFLMPAMIYYAVVTSPLTLDTVATVAKFGVACVLTQAALTYTLGRLRRAPADVRRVTMMTTMFHNSGNYGLPLQYLAFAAAGLGTLAASYQVFAMITQNMVNFTLGILIVSGGRKDRPWRANLRQIAKFPPLYALAAALLTLQVRTWLGPHAAAVSERIAPLWKVIEWAKGGFIGVALLTLGAQLATVRPVKQRYPLRMSVVLRLLGGPAIALGVMYAMSLTGTLAQVLLISASTPTAINVMLLALEFDNHPDFAARAVFWSTLASPITVTLAVFLARGGFLAALATP